MKPNNLKALIICFTFPPYPGIGGRRWAKFAKYLNREGVDIKVISAKKKKDGVSTWLTDIEEYKDRISYLPTHYPLILTTVPKTIIEKIRYKLALIYVKLLTKGNYYDYSVFWKRTLLHRVEKEIKAGYHNIIVSCAPFTTAFYISELKEKYPNINLIVDFRDPWTDNETSFGFSTLGKKRMDFEKFKEYKTTQRADYIITVSDTMTYYFERLASDNSKSLTLKNGFDSEDFGGLLNKSHANSQLRFIFTGTFYNKALHVLKSLCEALNDLKLSNKEIYKNLKFDFYGSVPTEFHSVVDDIDIVSFNGSIGKDEVYKQIRESDVTMLFLTDDLNHSFSTKFYEYIAQKKPIAVFSKAGDTANFIEQNNLGYNCSLQHIKEMLVKIYKDWKADNLIFNENYDISEHEISLMTRNKLIPLLR